MSTDSLKQKKELTNSKLQLKDEVKSSLESVLTIVGVIVFAFLVVFICKKIMGEEKEVTIATNEAEQFFYDKKYDEAIKEYEKLQEKEEWPVDIIKEAQVYSIKGEKDMCNRLLAKAYDDRNKLIYTNSEKYKDADGILGSEIALTAFINGNMSKALEYGEVFLLENSTNKRLQRVMELIYIGVGDNQKAQDIIDNYSLDDTSVEDLISYSKMNEVVGNSEAVLENLKIAWYLDKDEVKIFNVIEELINRNKVDTYKLLSKLTKKDSSEPFYKLMLAKYYSMSAEESEKGLNLLKEIEDNDLGDIMINIIKADLLKNSGDIESAEEIVNSLINNKDESYLIDNIIAWNYYRKGDYKNALNYAKYSVLKNPDYSESYGILIPSILNDSKESEKEEAYLRTALYKDPTNYNILRRTAEFYRDIAKNQEKAYEIYNILAKLYNSADDYYNMGIIKSSLDKNDEAVKLYEKAIEINDNVSQYYRDLGSIYLKLGDNEKGIKEIRKSYSLHKADIITLNNAAFYYIKVKGDVYRGTINLKSAYEGIKENTPTKVKDIITKNYNEAKTALDRYGKDANESIIKTLEIELCN